MLGRRSSELTGHQARVGRAVPTRTTLGADLTRRGRLDGLKVNDV